jgi:hypothetical protein
MILLCSLTFLSWRLPYDLGTTVDPRTPENSLDEIANFCRCSVSEGTSADVVIHEAVTAVGRLDQAFDLWSNHLRCVPLVVFAYLNVRRGACHLYLSLEARAMKSA